MDLVRKARFSKIVSKLAPQRGGGGAVDWARSFCCEVRFYGGAADAGAAYLCFESASTSVGRLLDEAAAALKVRNSNVDAGGAEHPDRLHVCVSDDSAHGGAPGGAPLRMDATLRALVDEGALVNGALLWIVRGATMISARTTPP